MRDLTREELEEYFQFAKKDKASDFNPEQAQLVGDVFMHFRIMDIFDIKAVMGLSSGFSPGDVMLSLWVTAFQMGRECESRLLTAALKGKH